MVKLNLLNLLGMDFILSFSLFQITLCQALLNFTSLLQSVFMPTPKILHSLYQIHCLESYNLFNLCIELCLLFDVDCDLDIFLILNHIVLQCEI